MHIDGAFGLWAGASPTHRHLVPGYQHADSWGTDAHKTLNVPFDCGIAIVAKPAPLRQALGISGDYLVPDAAGDPLDKVPEMSRRARGVPVWAALQSLGRSGVVDLVDGLVANAQAIAAGIAAIEGVEVLNDVVFTQVCFTIGDDERTLAVMKHLLAEGVTWMSGSRWADRSIIRVSVSNWSTDEQDVAMSVAAVRRAVEATASRAAVTFGPGGRFRSALCSGHAYASLRIRRPDGRMKRAPYERELRRLQAELVTMQEWVRAEGARLLVLFEGRDAAGKGSTIKRVTQYLNPRMARIVALPVPTERERGQWYFQRYVAQLPAAGEIVLMDRSWYNRAGVERVMGFCTPAEYRRFLAQCPVFERLLVEDGIMLRKYWFSVSNAEQERRFKSRCEDPMRRWKLSKMDVESILRWEDYSRAKDEMFVHTDIPESPWWVVEADDKRRARLNLISHLLTSVPYARVPAPLIEIPALPAAKNYSRPPRELFRSVPDHAASLRGGA